MPGMPYNVEKGPYLSMLEHLLNRDRAQTARCLRSLRDTEKRVTDLLREFPTPIEGGRYRDTAALADHIDEDWFALAPSSSGRETADQGPADVHRYWYHWRGNAEGVVRETLIRAIEVALGLDHGQQVPDPGRDEAGRHWHVSLLTTCGFRWFEGWLTWQKLGDEPHSGHVTALFLTPSHGQESEPTPLRPTDSTPRKPGPAYVVNPLTAVGDQGLWVTASVLERRVDPEAGSSEWRPRGRFPKPNLGPNYVGSTELVTVQPPEDQGGVLPNGRSYGREVG
jgi:hypothetical protein